MRSLSLDSPRSRTFARATSTAPTRVWIVRVPRSGAQDIGQWMSISSGRRSGTMLLVSFMAYRSPREVLAGSTPGSIRRLSHSVISHPDSSSVRDLGGSL